MASKKPESEQKRGFDFAQMDTVKKSVEGVFFPFLDMRTGEPVPGGAGAIMLGPDSPEFKRATNEIDRQTLASKSKKENIFAIQDEYELERTVACTVKLVDCFIGDREFSDKKEDIREFYKSLPWTQKQMDSRIIHRTNFLPDAAIAGSDS